MPPWSSTTPWLWLPESTRTFTSTHGTARIVLFRKQFTVPTSISSNTPIPIHASADTRYILFINGKRILFGPAKSYLHEYNYETIDISPFLIPGGEECPRRKSTPLRTSQGGEYGHGTVRDWGVYPARPFGFAGVIDNRGSEWNRALEPAFMQINEEVDGSLAEGGWLDGDYEDSAWLDAKRSSMKTPIPLSSAAEQEWIYEPCWFRTFRYIQLTLSTHSQPLQITSLTYRRTHYPLPISTTLTNIPSIEAKKWTISLNTLFNCMQETYTDCPFYEQNQFAFDSRLQMLYSYQLPSDDRLAKKTINELHASRRGSDGLVETHFPTPFPGVSIPIFSLSWVLMVWDYVMYAVDTEVNKGFVSKTYSGMVGRFGDGDSVNDDVWALIDWTAEWSVLGPGGDFKHLAVPPAYRRTGVASYNTEVCEFVGRLGLAEEYRTRAESINGAVIRHCLRADEDGQEILVDGPDSPSTERSQHVAVFAVLSGAVTGLRAKALLRRALHPDTREGYVKASYAQSVYVIAAAMQIGLYDELRDSLVQPWTEMVNLNLTT
ncbi:hypothetical protein BDV10DRAFT_184989 [Aspergillus recurvatus]